MSKPKTLTVEYFRLWDNNRWDTGFLELSGDLDPNDSAAVQKAIEEAADKIDWRDERPWMVGLYAFDEEWFDDDDEA